MTAMVALFAWVIHGLLLWYGWGQYRPRLALLHGFALAALAWALIGLGVPTWVLYVAGAATGAVAGWGHRLAPGLWVGLGLLWPLPFVLTSAAAVPAIGALALTAQVIAFLVSFTKSSL